MYRKTLRSCWVLTSALALVLSAEAHYLNVRTGKEYDTFTDAAQAKLTVNGDTIKYTGSKDFEDSEYRLKCDKDLTLDFQGKQLYATWTAVETFLDLAGDLEIINEGSGTVTLKNLTLKQPYSYSGKNVAANITEVYNISLQQGKFVFEDVYVWDMAKEVSGWSAAKRAADRVTVIICEGASLSVTGGERYQCKFSDQSTGSIVVTGGAYTVKPTGFIDDDKYEIVQNATGAYRTECPWRVRERELAPGAIDADDEEGRSGGEVIVPSGSDTAILVPEDDVQSVEVQNLGDMDLAVPPQIKSVSGLSEDAELIVVADATNATQQVVIDITDAFNITQEGDTRKIELNPDAVIDVKIGDSESEPVAVVPVLATKDATVVEEKPFVVKDDEVSVGVKTIPGLTYRLIAGDSAGSITNVITEGVRAKDTRLVIETDRNAKAKFFKVIVEQ